MPNKIKYEQLIGETKSQKFRWQSLSMGKDDRFQYFLESKVMNHQNTMLETIQKLNDVYIYLMSTLSDSPKHNLILEEMLEIIEDLEYEYK